MSMDTVPEGKRIRAWTGEGRALPRPALDWALTVMDQAERTRVPGQEPVRYRITDETDLLRPLYLDRAAVERWIAQCRSGS